MNSAVPAAGPRKLIIGLAGLAILAMFVSSFVYRMQHPSLRVERKAQAEAQPSEMPGAAQIGMLMAKIKENPKDIETLRQLGELFDSMRAFDRSSTFWRRLLAVDPKDLEAVNGLGIALFNMNDFKGAAEQFQRYLELEPGNAPAHFNLGLINRYEFKDEKAALEHFRAAKALKWDDPELARSLDEELAK